MITLTVSHPPTPTGVADRHTRAAHAIAVRFRRIDHSQHCPVWTRSSDIDACDCWILSDSRNAARDALAAADKEV